MRASASASALTPIPVQSRGRGVRKCRVCVFTSMRLHMHASVRARVVCAFEFGFGCKRSSQPSAWPRHAQDISISAEGQSGSVTTRASAQAHMHAQNGGRQQQHMGGNNSGIWAATTTTWAEASPAWTVALGIQRPWPSKTCHYKPAHPIDMACDA